MDDVALEEGRIALYQLEKQLKTGANNNNDNSENSVGSRQLSYNSERRILDQMPRDTRLHNRKGSPLGLTVEVKSPVSPLDLTVSNCLNHDVSGTR